MTVEEARELYEQYKKEIHWNNDHTNDDALFEVTEFLLEQTKDPWYSSELGSHYYERRQFDLARKYYELTYELGDRTIASCLGYIWYYGRTGTVDYEKAFRYFSEAANLGNGEAKRKLADMYKNGYFVEQNYPKYCAIIEELYEEHKEDEHKFIELPDICTRLAGIRKAEGNIPEAIRLYRMAKDYLPRRLQLMEFFGDINVMDWLINDLYSITEPDYSDLDIYDLFYVMKEPVTVTFRFKRKKFQIRSVMENGEYAVEFDGHWYRSVNELFQKAKLEGKPIYVWDREIYDVEVKRDGAD